MTRYLPSQRQWPLLMLFVAPYCNVDREDKIITKQKLFSTVRPSGDAKPYNGFLSIGIPCAMSSIYPITGTPAIIGSNDPKRCVPAPKG